MPEPTPGQLNYDAYAAERCKTGPSLVGWDELGSVRQAAWEAGAAAVLATRSAKKEKRRAR